MKNKEMVAVEKDVFMTLMNIISLTAFSYEMLVNDIAMSCHIGKTKESQGEKFTHDWNYDCIRKSLSRMSEVNHILYNAIPSDDSSSITAHIKYIARSMKFKELLKYYGADLSNNGNFDNI